MGIVSRSTLKSYFERGDQPTEAQFIDLLDSVVNINDDNVYKSVNTVSELKSLNMSGIPDDTIINILGHTAASDGGGGFVYYDSSLSSFDEGKTYESDVSNGGFRRPDSDFVNVKWYGVGLSAGSFSDDSSFINAIESSDTIIIPANTTVSLGGDTNKIDISSQKSLIGIDRTSKVEFDNQSPPAGSFVYPLWFNASTASTTTLSGDVDEGDVDIPLSSVTGLSVGDLIELEDSGNAERSRILEIKSNTVTIQDRLYRGYTSANTTVTVYNYASVNITNITWETKSNDIFAMLLCYYLQDSNIKNNYFVRDDLLGEYAGRIGLLFRYGNNSIISDNITKDYNNTGNGYGIQLYGSRTCKVYDNQILNCRSFDLSSNQNGCIDNLVSNNQVVNYRNGVAPDGSESNETRGLSTHAGVFKTKFIGYKVIGVRQGILDRGDFNIFENNTISDSGRINFTSGTKVVSKNNDYINIEVIENERDTFLSTGDHIKITDETIGDYLYIYPLESGSFTTWIIRDAYIEIDKQTTGEVNIFGSNTATSGNFIIQNFIFSANVEGSNFSDEDLVVRPDFFAPTLLDDVSINYLNVVPSTMTGTKSFFLTSDLYNLGLWAFDESLEITFRYDRVKSSEIVSSFGRIEVVGSRDDLSFEGNKSSSFSDEFVFGVAENAIEFSQVSAGFRYNYQSGGAISVAAVGSNNEFTLTVAPWDSNPGWNWGLWSAQIHLTAFSNIRLVSAEFI